MSYSLLVANYTQLPLSVERAAAPIATLVLLSNLSATSCTPSSSSSSPSLGVRKGEGVEVDPPSSDGITRVAYIEPFIESWASPPLGGGVPAAIPHADEVVVARVLRNLSSVCVSPCGKAVYACNEEAEGLVVALDSATLQRSPRAKATSNGGAVVVRRIRVASWQSTLGRDPCHIACTSQSVFVANYSSGTVAIFPLLDGSSSCSLGSCSRLLGGFGPLGAVTDRQEAYHAHCVRVSASNQGAELYTCDLGSNTVSVWNTRAVSEPRVENQECMRRLVRVGESAEGTVRPLASVVLQPGDGTRHIALNEGASVAYVVNELSATVATLRLPSLTVLQRASTVALMDVGSDDVARRDLAADCYPAAVVMHPSRRALFVSNRNAFSSTIAMFAIEEATGLLVGRTMVQRLSSEKHVSIEPMELRRVPCWPRDAVATGHGLWVACERAATIAFLPTDAATGQFVSAGGDSVQEVLALPSVDHPAGGYRPSGLCLLPW